ncbi:5055_t:CDS:2 [Dentiscutata erythropus]|uniref:5055_t:CDS:1 n=1 Tax=Dentiscutata erythropus TaxID=1348616 RepID=A0A9N9AXR9_9GLOM|nr:5055_t:CDS:2 [Dentiscutata erythropus]
MANQQIDSVSCVEASYRLIDEIKHIIINLKRSKKIFDPIIHSSSETVRALHYVKNEVELYFQQYEDAFNKYKISLENIKEFAKEIANIEKSHYLFYPYRHVKEKYEKLLKEHENCEKKLNPILIKVIMNKQESQQEDFKNVHEMTHYMEPKITNFYLAKHVTEIGHDNEDGVISDYILRIINWYAPEMMQNNAIYTHECEIYSYVMLLWELAFQRVPYEKMSTEEIVTHVTNGRRESPEPPFYTLEFLNIQNKYLRIVAEGWVVNPEKRIRMDDILLRLSSIEADFTKPKRNNSGSVHSSDQLDQRSHIRTRAASVPVKPYRQPHQLLLRSKDNESRPDKHTIPDSPGFSRILSPRESRKSRPSSILTPRLEPVKESYTYFTATPLEMDFPESYKIESSNEYYSSSPSNTSYLISPEIVIEPPKADVVIKSPIKTSNLIKTIEVNETTNNASNLIKYDEVIETSDEPLNSIKTETIEEPNETLDLIETNDVNGTKQSRPSSMSFETPDLMETTDVNGNKPSRQTSISFDDSKSRPSSMSFDDVIRSRPSSVSFDDVYETKQSRQSSISLKSSELSDENENEPSDISDDDPIPSENKKIKSLETPSSQNLQEVPSSISEELYHALIVNTEKKLLTAALTCAFTSKPKMKILDTIKFKAKLMHSSTFLLENHIESTKLELNWISDVDTLNNISQVDSVYLEIKYPKAEVSFEKGSIKPSKEFTSAIQNALDNKNLYRELIKVFEKFGHFLPSKVILGDKLYSISKLSSLNPKSPEPRSINKEFKTADDFSTKCNDYKDIINQWDKYVKSYNIDPSSLTSINGDVVKRNCIKEWAISCLKKSPDSLKIISWEGLYPLYEILNSHLCQEVKLCLGNDEQTISSGVKEKVLKSGVIPIKSSQFKYRVNFDSSLESTNYKIFGKVLKQDGTQFENADVNFISKDKSGFSAIIEIFSDDKLDDLNLQITWALIGIPSEVGIFESNTRSIPIAYFNKRTFTPKAPVKDATGIETCDIQLKTSEILQSSAILITTFKYPKSDYNQYFIAKVKDYRDKTIHVNISVRKTENESLDEIEEEDYCVKVPELHWCVLLLDEDDETNLAGIGQNVHGDYSSSDNSELNLSYKKLDTETGKELIEVLKTNKTYTSLDISYNNIGVGLAKQLRMVLESNEFLTRLNLKATCIEPDIVIQMIRANKTRLVELNLSSNSEKFTKKGKALIEALGKNTSLITLNLSENPFDWSDVSFTPLESNKCLENLDLSSCNLTPKTVERLRKFLITSKNLKSLNLSSNNLAFQSERIISEILAKNKTLRVLNLSTNKISSTIESLDRDSKTSLTGRVTSQYKYRYDMARALKVNNLAEAIKKNKTLKKLDLSCNYIRLEAGRNLARALTNNKFITDLNLNDNDIVHELGEFLMTILSNNNITGKSLKSTKISSEMVKTLSQDLKSNKVKLRYLNLSRNEINGDAMVALIEALEENTTLRNLDLSAITGAGQIGRELTKSLEKNKTLKTLNLSSCNIRINVVNALENALRTNDTLSDLDLSNNSCSMSNLLKALETNRSLIKLNISDRDFFSDDIEALANALKINNTLTHLYISRTMDEPEIGKPLFEALEVNKRLTDLDLSRNSIKEIEIIAKALLNNVSLRRCIEKNPNLEISCTRTSKAKHKCDRIMLHNREMIEIA